MLCLSFVTFFMRKQYQEICSVGSLQESRVAILEALYTELEFKAQWDRWDSLRENGNFCCRKSQQ